MDEDQRALEEFKQLTELLRFYTNLVLQTLTFVLTATGAVVAYVIKDFKEAPYSPYGFAIPAALCIGMGVGFLINVSAARGLLERLRELTNTLRFGLPPHGTILVGSLRFFGILLIATGLGLSILLIRLRP